MVKFLLVLHVSLPQCMVICQKLENATIYTGESLAEVAIWGVNISGKPSSDIEERFLLRYSSLCWLLRTSVLKLERFEDLSQIIATVVVITSLYICFPHSTLLVA